MALSAPAQCELRFVGPPDGMIRGSTPPGTQLEIRLRGATSLFAGEVTAVEYVYNAERQLELRVRAHDPMHRLQKRQSVRAFERVDAATLARQLMSDLKIEVVAAETGPEWPYIIQTEQSDFELLTDLCERAGLYFVLRDGKCHLLSLEGQEGAGASLRLALGGELLEAVFEINGATACRRIVAHGWDVAHADLLEAQVQTARTGRVVNTRVEPADVGGCDPRLLSGLACPANEHVQAAAQAELDRLAAGEVVARGVAEGSPLLRPGARVTLEGVAPLVAGTYVLAEVIHTINPESGYLCAFSTEPPASAHRSRATITTLGRVSRVDDPQALGRVRVSLATFGDVETDWIQVAALGAGAKKGFMILPDTGDLVLVAFIDGDPSHAVVLGGLFGGAGASDPGVEGREVRRYSLLTAGGNQIVLDDVRRTLRMVDAEGSHVELGPLGVSVSSKVALTIEAPGQTMVLRAKTIDFERG
jgi:phage protein D